MLQSVTIIFIIVQLILCNYYSFGIFVSTPANECKGLLDLGGEYTINLQIDVHVSFLTICKY